jgi:formate dehydrogenase subunit delta
MSPDEKLIYMANQIAAFFAAQGRDKAIAGVADHLKRFWEPHMRERLLQLAPGHGKELNPYVLDALPLLTSKAK